MSAMSKSVKTLVLLAILSAGSAQAGPGPCMPMQFMSGDSGCGGAQAAPASQQACAVPGARSEQETGCSSGDMAGTLGNMAAGGMNIAMTVIGAIFGAPAK